MTSSEIVKALRCCRFEAPCAPCPAVSNRNCVDVMHEDAADLIERLEKEKAALLESLRGRCISCKHWTVNTMDCKIFEGCAACEKECKCKDCGFGNNWEWKGLEDEK